MKFIFEAIFFSSRLRLFQLFQKYFISDSLLAWLYHRWKSFNEIDETLVNILGSTWFSSFLFTLTILRSLFNKEYAALIFNYGEGKNTPLNYNQLEKSFWLILIILDLQFPIYWNWCVFIKYTKTYNLSITEQTYNWTTRYIIDW